MKKNNLILMIVMVFISNTIAFSQNNQGRIYGKIVGSDGETYEGRINWGGDEVVWNATFDATFRMSSRTEDTRDDRRSSRRKSRRVSSSNVTWMMYYGNIVSIERRGSRAVVLLKDGREYRVEGGDSDDGVVIFDIDFGETKLSWREIDIVEFMDEPRSYADETDDRAYAIFGTVETSTNLTLKGFIKWDKDENLSTDILDGNQRGKRRKIAFSKIKSIESLGRRSSEIVLWSGKTMELGGINDVDASNRGIVVSDKNYGEVVVKWRDFEKITFQKNVSGFRYSDFKTPKPLYGTLEDEYGEKHEGFIRWDDDESYTSDFLNGTYREMQTKIEFSNIREIKRRTRSSAVVTLRNGEVLLLKGYNDVNSQNKGIFVLEKADDTKGKKFSWDEFERVIFKK